MKFDLRTGGEVSYRNTSGNEVPAVLLEIDGFSTGVPIGAKMRLDGGLPDSTVAVKFMGQTVFRQTAGSSVG